VEDEQVLEPLHWPLLPAAGTDEDQGVMGELPPLEVWGGCSSMLNVGAVNGLNRYVYTCSVHRAGQGRAAQPRLVRIIPQFSNNGNAIHTNIRTTAAAVELKARKGLTPAMQQVEAAGDTDKGPAQAVGANGYRQ
jgi:hypothetical protein